VDSSLGKLNPLLRLAAISGVETAIILHIRRGDDVNARDQSGATPLILAAAKRKKGAVRLLLDAGAKPALVDLNGMDALSHAVKGGCVETIGILTEALAGHGVSKYMQCHIQETSKPSSTGIESALVLQAVELPQIADNFQPDMSPRDDEGLSAQDKKCPSLDAKIDDEGIRAVELLMVLEVLHLDDEALNDFVADDWEAEEIVAAPEGDKTLAEAARHVHDTIRRHRIVDRDEDWGDVDLHLPDRAAPLAHEDGRGDVRDLLLVALREGMISENNLIDVCLNADGSRNEEAERLIALVAGELEAAIVEWTGLDEPSLKDPTIEEERLLAEAAEFAEELASGRNDPSRFYAKDIGRELLEAAEEISLGREMEEAGLAALFALAVWPAGLSSLFEAAALVSGGDADAESFCAGPEPYSEDESVSQSLVTSDEVFDDDESELSEEGSFFVNAVAAVEAAQGNAHNVVKALEETRLTRRFLMELGDKASQCMDGHDFLQAIHRQASARERMILCNLRLALAIAKKFLWSGVPLDDLVQEANIGLIKAVERYDWRKGFRFSTYATWWIRQQISRSIADTSRVVRAPVHVQETARKILREREAVEAELGRLETESETARREGLSLAKTRMLISIFEDVASLDEIDANTGLYRADSLIDANALDPADIAESTSLRSTLLGMLEVLDDRSREVMLLRSGLMGDDEMTLEEVGQHFGVTRERIRQIESKVMRKLSHRNKLEILWPFMGDAYAPSRSNAHYASYEASPKSGDKVLPDDEEKETVSILPPRPGQGLPTEQDIGNLQNSENTLPDNVAPTTLEQMLVEDLASRIVDEAKALGLQVEDRRPQGGELRIVAPYASPPKVRAFGRRLLAAGFRRIQRDVFAK
jgi:RNA polymerase primary sigma factor